MGAGDITSSLTSHLPFLCSSYSGPRPPSPTLSHEVKACLLVDKAPLLLAPGYEMNPKFQNPLSPTKKAVGNGGLGAEKLGLLLNFLLWDFRQVI